MVSAIGRVYIPYRPLGLMILFGIWKSASKINQKTKNKYTNLTEECPVNSGSQKHKLICKIFHKLFRIRKLAKLYGQRHVFAIFLSTLSCLSSTYRVYTERVHPKAISQRLEHTYRILAIVRDSGAAAAPSQFMARGIFLALFLYSWKNAKCTRRFSAAFQPPAERWNSEMTQQTAKQKGQKKINVKAKGRKKRTTLKSKTKAKQIFVVADP